MWPQLIMLAASAFMKYQAEQDASEQRESRRKSMESYQRSKAADTKVATDALLDKQTPKARGQELQTITGDRQQSLRDTVGAAQAFDAPQIAGKLSGDYKSTQEANAAMVAERTRRAIEQLATMGAPGEQAQAFSRRFGKAAGDVDANNRASENVGRGYLDDISRIVPDPGMMMIAEGVGGASSAMGGAGGVNNGQGFEDAAGNLYDPNVATRPRAKVNGGLAKAFSLWGK